MDMDSLTLVVTFKVNDLDQVKKVAQQCVEFVTDQEPGTLIYDWHFSDDGTSGKLLEVYRSTKDFQNHLEGKVFTSIGQKFSNSIKWEAIESFGTLPPLFHKLLGHIPHKNWNNATVKNTQAFSPP